MNCDYDTFVKSKDRVDPATGFDVDPSSLNPALFEFQRDIVTWAIRRGRACIWADCGLGKTLMQMEWARAVRDETKGDVLIVAPLAVARQTSEEGARFGIDVHIAASDDDLRPGINVTNYEKLGKFDLGRFAGLVLDESSILKNYSGKIRNQIIEAARGIPYRLACTATPAPNDTLELGNHSEFVGAMSHHEMLASFFLHDGGETQKWRLRGHAASDFWKWVSSWAVLMRKPSDLGYSDDGFQLPELRMHRDEVAVDFAADGVLFDIGERTLADRRRARRESIEQRVAHAAHLVNASDEPWIVWCDMNRESELLTAAIDGAVEVRGSDLPEVKEDRMDAFKRGDARVIVTKPSIAGWGMNWQHCSKMAFVGLSDSFEQMYQAIRRSWRFGQTRPVDVHIVTASSEGPVVQNIERKSQQAEDMYLGMLSSMSSYNRETVHRGTARTKDTYKMKNEVGNGWDARLGDCVDVVGSLPDESIDFSVFSPPFASLYTYSASDRDMGNCASQDEFIGHFRFLVVEMFRAMKPGRLVSFHCMNLPTSKARDGVIGIRDFRGEMIRLFEECGWIYHSEVVIWKDPVTAMQRTKALGLLHKQICKDSAMSRQGIPDYLVTMRKPGVNPEPISGELTHWAGEGDPGHAGRRSINIWQRYASPVWMDINPSDTLQYRSAREESDERHICPLQLQVIRRALELWSNPGDLVLSPFMGIGSEGFESIKAGRRFIGAELKESYWKQAVKNLRAAEIEAGTADLFATGADESTMSNAAT